MKKRSNFTLKTRLILSFVLIAVLPIIFTIWAGYQRTNRLIRENAQKNAQSRLAQSRANLDVWLESYEDILFQIYTNDEIVEMIDTINLQDNNLTVTKGQLRRTLRGMFYTKEYIKCITILTESGEIVFYDLLTGKSTVTSWLENAEYTEQELYEMISEDNATHVLTTQEAGVYASERYYLFHLGHRIIDYRNVDRRLGVVIVSIDENMLKEVCGSQQGENECTFLADGQGRLLSYPDQELLGTQAIEWTKDSDVRKQRYLEFVRKQGLFDSEHISLHTVWDDKFGCDIVTVENQHELMQTLSGQQSVMALVMAVTAVLLITVILILTYRLTASLNTLVGTMKEAESGALSARAAISGKMLPEVQTIAEQFNHMLKKVEQSVEREKVAIERQKNAEIEALEAQINPHFLYNTLDTINWMAIDEDQFEISNAIMALATILRYGIDKSNSVVTVRQECDWLKQYIFLQQTRLKDEFECEIHVAPEVQGWNIHKLLLQPFIENAIIHGFKGKAGIHRLEVTIRTSDEALCVEIYDNGAGISREIVERMNQGEFPETGEKNHIGMKNAMTRIRMYYGEESSVRIKSREGEFTTVIIRVPKRV